MEDTQVFYGIGNHDLVKGTYGEELFENSTDRYSIHSMWETHIT